MSDTLNYREYVERLHSGIGWMRGVVAERLSGLLAGVMADFIAEAAREAIYARWPSYAAEDALEELGVNRSLPHLPTQSTASYRLTLRRAFELHRLRGTPRGIGAIMTEYAQPGAPIAAWTLLEDFALSVPFIWSRWLLVLRGGEHTIPLAIIPMGTAVMGAVTMGGETPASIVATLRRMLRWAKRATSVGVVVITDGDCVMGIATMGIATMGGTEMRVSI